MCHTYHTVGLTEYIIWKHTVHHSLRDCGQHVTWSIAKTWAKRVMQACRKKFTSNKLQGLFHSFQILLREGPELYFFVQIIKCSASKACMICHLLLKQLALWTSGRFIHSLIQSPQKQIQLFLLMPTHSALQTQSRSLLKNKRLNPESALSYRGTGWNHREFISLETDLSSFEQASRSKTT